MLVFDLDVADGWEPLLALADCDGEGWGARARATAIAPSGESVRDDDSLGAVLLRDIQSIYDRTEEQAILPVHGFHGHLIGAGCPGRGGVHDQLRTGIERA